MPQNGINHPGVTALAQAFAINPLLRVINLNDNTFTEKGAVAMAKVRREWQGQRAVSRVWLLPFFCFLNLFIYFEREIAREEQREGERESQPGSTQSPLWGSNPSTIRS